MLAETNQRPSEGWRERKRGQTRQRIAEVGMRLFLERGFEATTLDAIAETAGIARRTFFHYFDSKEALLFAYEDKAEQAFRTALAQILDDIQPFEAMRIAMLAMVSEFGTAEARTLDRLMRSTAALHARKQSNYARQERFLLAAFTEKWPDQAQQKTLQLVAMIGMGTMRIAADAWSAASDERPLQVYLIEYFSKLIALQKS